MRCRTGVAARQRMASPARAGCHAAMDPRRDGNDHETRRGKNNRRPGRDARHATRIHSENAVRLGGGAGFYPLSARWSREKRVKHRLPARRVADCSARSSGRRCVRPYDAKSHLPGRFPRSGILVVILRRRRVRIRSRRHRHRIVGSRGVADDGALRTSWFGTAAAARARARGGILCAARRFALREVVSGSDLTSRRGQFYKAGGLGCLAVIAKVLVRCWHAACKSVEEQRDGAPVILRLMGACFDGNAIAAGVAADGPARARSCSPAPLRFQRRAGHTHAQQECGACAEAFDVGLTPT